jgi:signal transduction histidine kinase
MKLNFIHNPVINPLLNSLSAFLAILKDDLKIVAANDVTKQFLGVDGNQEVLGMGIGEAIMCSHAGRTPNGCGSGEICHECGLYMIIASSLESGRAEERKFSLRIESFGKIKELFLKAHCSHLTIESKRFLLLFLQDITFQQKLIALERKIFHQINNSITGLVGTTQVMNNSSNELDEKLKELLQINAKLSSRLVKETVIQRAILQSEAFFNPQPYDSVSISNIFREIKETFSHILVAENKSILFTMQHDNVVIKTNLNFLLIVLNHMVKNALEETDKGDNIKVWTQLPADQIIFNVWNRKPLSEYVAKRIFQRNFSTKPEMGRGYGTYTMKLFGEEILGGIVDFTASDNGTVFRISLSISE